MAISEHTKKLKRKGKLWPLWHNSRWLGSLLASCCATRAGPGEGRLAWGGSKSRPHCFSFKSRLQCSGRRKVQVLTGAPVTPASPREGPGVAGVAPTGP